MHPPCRRSPASRGRPENTELLRRRSGPPRCPNSRRWLPPAGGALVALVMIAMIGKGVTSGIAASTKVSSFAVVHALLVGRLAFRELMPRSTVRVFVRAAGVRRPASRSR